MTAKAKRKALYKKPRLKRAKSDWYIEPQWATELLLAHEEFIGTTWDPCCGMGNVAEAFRAGGRKIVATDLVDRGYKHLAGVMDFTQPNVIASAQPIQNIACNPPYKRAVEFIRRARELFDVRKVAMFLPLKFLTSEERYLFFKAWPPVRVWVFSSRPSCPPGKEFVAGKIKAEGGTESYAWFVWSRHERPTKGRPSVCWLIKPESLSREKRATTAEAA